MASSTSGSTGATATGRAACATGTRAPAGSSASPGSARVHDLEWGGLVHILIESPDDLHAGMNRLLYLNVRNVTLDVFAQCGDERADLIVLLRIGDGVRGDQPIKALLDNVECSVYEIPEVIG